MRKTSLARQADINEGLRLKNEGMERVEENAGEVWNEYALGIIRDVAARAQGGHITGDDIAAALEHRPHDLRALGPVMLRAKKLGIVVATRRFQESSRPENHCRPIRLWHCPAQEKGVAA